MIRGQHIILRAIEEKDLEIIQALTMDLSELGLYSTPHLKSFSDFKKSFYDHGFLKKNFGILVITDLQGRLLGMVQHFKGMLYSTGYELGAKIYRESDRSKGYITEAVKLYTAYLFEQEPIARVDLSTSIENIGAQKVAEKCGFTYEGTHRKCIYLKGVPADIKRYSILRDEVKPLSELIKQKDQH